MGDHWVISMTEGGHDQFVGIWMVLGWLPLRGDWVVLSRDGFKWNLRGFGVVFG